MTEKIMDNFDIRAALSIVDDLKREIKHKQQVVDVIMMISKAKGIDRERDTTNKTIIKEIEKNRSYLTEAVAKAKNAELKAASEQEKSDARVSTVLDKEAEKTEEINKRIEARAKSEEEKINSIEAETASRINTAKVAAKNAERDAMDAEKRKGEAEEALTLVKNKILSV